MSAVPRGAPDLFAAPARLRFIRTDRWHEVSDCGRYTVSKADMGEAFEREHGVRFRYDAWRRGKDGSKIPANLGCFNSAAEAEVRCQAHLEGRYTPPKSEIYQP